MLSPEHVSGNEVILDYRRLNTDEKRGPDLVLGSLQECITIAPTGSADSHSFTFYLKSVAPNGSIDAPSMHSMCVQGVKVVLHSDPVHLTVAGVVAAHGATHILVLYGHQGRRLSCCLPKPTAVMET